MSIIIDNGNVHAPATDDRWTPHLRGDLYCSPACGYSCRKADFDRATERAGALAKALGSSWVPRVWENCGWHYDVRKSVCVVTASQSGEEYEASIQFPMGEGGSGHFSATDSCPREAVEAVQAEVSKRIEALQRTLRSMALDAIEIELVR